MLLYHGTSEHGLERILKQGIRSRGRRGKSKGNWKHTVPSHPDCVYFTSAYGLYYAIQASSPVKGKPVVLQIDTDVLNPFNLWPDEDFLAQAHSANKLSIVGETTERWALNQYFIERLQDYAHLWERSLKGMGTCAYYGPVPVTAIRQYAIVDVNHHQKILGAHAVDPTISVLNYQVVGIKYRAMTKWLFNIPLGEDEPPTLPTINPDGSPSTYKLWTPPEHRKGIDLRGVITPMSPIAVAARGGKVYR